MQITPAILPQSYTELNEKINLLRGLSSSVQIDLCDGVFGKTKTWLPDEEKIYLPQGFDYEFDVMMFSWKIYIPICISLGARRIVVHVDNFTEEECYRLLSYFENTNIKLGISVSNDTSIEEHIKYIRFFSEKNKNIYVQVMGIRNIGAQGEFFDEECLLRIKEIKKNFGDVVVQVDGSMNIDTVRKVKDSGAEIAVVGSYLFGHEDIDTRLNSLKEV